MFLQSSNSAQADTGRGFLGSAIKRKNNLAMILSATMVLSMVLTGCGSGDTSSSSGSSSSSSSSASSKTAVEAYVKEARDIFEDYYFLSIQINDVIATEDSAAASNLSAELKALYKDFVLFEAKTPPDGYETLHRSLCQFGTSTFDLTDKVIEGYIEYFNKGSFGQFFSSNSDLNQMIDRRNDTYNTWVELLNETFEKAGVDPLNLK